MNFELGTRVVAIGGYMGNREIIGKQGTVISINPASISVEFDSDVDGHDAYGKGKYGYCWDFFFSADCLRFAPIDVSDFVNVSDMQCVYTNYKQWVQDNAPAYFPFWKEDCTPDASKKYKVLLKAPAGKFPPFNQKTLCLIGSEAPDEEFSELPCVFVVAEEGIFVVK